jgi:hypothetical protein
MAIRTVLIAPEADYGVAAAGPYIFMRVEKWTPVNEGKLDIPRETTGSTIVTHTPRPGPRSFNFSGRARGYFDHSMHWFNMAMGVPATSTVLGAQQHIFKPGGISPNSYTILWKQVSGSNVMWRQATGCKVKEIKTTIMGNGGLGFEFSGHGLYATSIAAPTVPADTTAAYAQPFAMDQQALTLGGAEWRKPKKFDLTVDNGLEPDWSIFNTRDFDRLKLGDSTMKGDLETFLDAYVGSILEAQDSSTSLLGQIILLVASADVIGTTVPSFIVTMPKPYVGDASEDDSNTDAEAKGSIEFGYDSATASNAKFQFTNMVPASIFTGS